MTKVRLPFFVFILVKVLEVSAFSTQSIVDHKSAQFFSSSSSALCNSASGISSSTTTTTTTLATDRNAKVQEVLTLARAIGPVGMLASPEDRERLEIMSKALLPYSDPNPSNVPLRHVHNLVYSASEGSSSGRLFGSVYGKVEQDFWDDNQTFINSVSFGPFQAALRATRSVKNDSTSLVKFHQTTIRVFGQTLLDKEIKGGGFWKYLFMGKIVDTDGKEKLVRIMETPSLFILEQAL